MTGTQLMDRLIAAHGGRERWQRVARIDARLSSGGLAFTTHCQPCALRDLHISVAPHRREVILRNFCRSGWQGVWMPRRVEIRDDGDALVAERQNPRASFGRLVKQVRWDKLDILYFAGYALWNYLSFPFILETSGVSVSCLEAIEPGESSRLVADFDATVPTHSPRQTFHLDGNCHLLRHDYTADVIGTWATAANCCLASEEVAGLRFYTRRKVFPRLGRGQAVLPFPMLVWIEIDDIEIAFQAPVS